jgi:hypothetical protein
MRHLAATFLTVIFGIFNYSDNSLLHLERVPSAKVGLMCGKSPTSGFS